jgi:hypothetical protein
VALEQFGVRIGGSHGACGRCGASLEHLKGRASCDVDPPYHGAGAVDVGVHGAEAGGLPSTLRFTH